jgi:hypothetical protein
MPKERTLPKSETASVAQSATRYRQYPLGEAFELTLASDTIRLRWLPRTAHEYTRERDGQVVARRLLRTSEGIAIAVYPVAPVNVPTPVAAHVQLRLDPPVLVPPRSQMTFYVPMPTEIGVFAVAGDATVETVDILSLSSPKYGLYGIPEDGVVCRHHVAAPQPQAFPPQTLAQALVMLAFRSNLDEWATVSRVVLPAAMMDFYYKEELVYLERVEMELQSERTASVRLINQPPEEGLMAVPVMAKAQRQRRLLNLAESMRFTMDRGY